MAGQAENASLPKRFWCAAAGMKASHVLGCISKNTGSRSSGNQSREKKVKTLIAIITHPVDAHREEKAGVFTEVRSKMTRSQQAQDAGRELVPGCKAKHFHKGFGQTLGQGPRRVRVNSCRDVQNWTRQGPGQPIPTVGLDQRPPESPSTLNDALVVQYLEVHAPRTHQLPYHTMLMKC